MKRQRVKIIVNSSAADSYIFLTETQSLPSIYCVYSKASYCWIGFRSNRMV